MTGKTVAEIWTGSGLPDYYEHHRRSIDDLYESESFFLLKLLTEGISILDIGCAVGGFCSIVGERLKNFRYTGVDISEEMVSRARQRHPSHRFRVVPQSNLKPLGSEKFDLVLCLGVLHLTGPWRELLEAAWTATARHLLVDFRETPLDTIENPAVSHLRMNFRSEGGSSEDVLPYNIINMSEVANTILRLCGDSVAVSRYGYLAPPSSAAVTPIDQLFMTTYLLDRLAVPNS